jgi:hypothetical protein
MQEDQEMSEMTRKGGVRLGKSEEWKGKAQENY